MLSKKLLVPSKKNVIYLALTFIALLCGCQEREKTIYKVPLNEHAMEYTKIGNDLMQISQILQIGWQMAYFGNTIG